MKKMAVVIALSCLAHLCMAVPISVGRAEVILPGENWVDFVLKDDVSTFGGDKDGVVNSEKKVFVKTSSSHEVEAMIVVSGSRGGLGGGRGAVLRFSPNCFGNEHWYANGNEGFNLPFLQCWGALKGGPNPLNSLAKIAPELTPLIDKHQWKMSDGTYYMFSRYHSQNGTFLDLRIFLSPGFAQVGAVENDAVESTLSGLDSKVFAYGKQLSQAVRASVTSFSGKLTLPEFSFPTR